VLLNDLGEALEKSRVKSMDTITKYKDFITIPGMESDTLHMLPSFRGFMLTAYEETLKQFDMIPKKLGFTGESTVANVIRKKISLLPQVYPVDNCLISAKVQRPRFRSPNLDFFLKFNQCLEEELSSMGKNQTSTFLDENMFVF
jgi:hypothetical protein